MTASMSLIASLALFTFICLSSWPPSTASLSSCSQVWLELPITLGEHTLYGQRTLLIRRSSMVGQIDGD